MDAQEPLLSVGSLAFDATPPPAGLEQRSEYPDIDAVAVVTDRLIINAWGYIRGPEKRLEREPTQITALKNLGGIAVDLRPGEPHGDGLPSRHHEVMLTFVDGTTLQLPNSEWLTKTGPDRMESLVSPSSTPRSSDGMEWHRHLAGPTGRDRRFSNRESQGACSVPIEGVSAPCTHIGR